MSETCRGHLWDKIIVKLFASSWYIFLTYIYDAQSHLYHISPSPRRLPQAGNILYSVHTFCHPTLQYHNSYNRKDNYRQWNAVGSPDDGHKDARNMLRYYWLPINHYLLYLVGLTFTYLKKMQGHSNIKYFCQFRPSSSFVRGCPTERYIKICW